MRCSGSFVVSICLAFASAVTSEAQVPQQVSVSWDGPPSCPRPPTLEAEVGRRLGSDAASIEAAEIALRVRERAGRYELSMEIERAGPDAEREVELADCAEVRRAAVLLITTALAPGRGEDAAPPAEAATPEPESPTPAWSLRAGALADLRALPKPTFGPALGVGYGPRNLRAWAEARYLARARSDRAEVLVDIDLFAGALGAAYVFRAGPFAFGPVAEAEFGAQRVRSVGNGSAPGARWADWECVLLGGLLDWETRVRLGISLTVLGGVPLRRAVFELDRESGSPRAHTTPAVTGRLQLAFRLLLATKKTVGGGQ